jgi:hypothetical protein
MEEAMHNMEDYGILLQSRKYTRVQGEVNGKLEAKIDYRFKKP